MKELSLRSVTATLLMGLALVALAHALAFDSWRAFFAGIDFNEQPFEDFLGVYLPMGECILERPEPVPGFFYSPAFALALVPFAGLEQLTAVWWWLGVQVVALLTLLLLPLGLRSDDGEPRAICGVHPGLVYLMLAVCSFPWLHNLHWGQASVFVALFSVAGFVLYRRERPILAGLAFSLAIAIKFYPALLLLPFVLKKERRVWGAALGFSFVWLLALPIALLGRAETINFYADVVEGLRAAQASVELWAEASNKQFLPAVVARHFFGTSPSVESVRAVWMLGLGLFAWPLVLCWRERESRVRPLEFAALIGALPLCVDPSWPHYFVLLPFACFVCLYSQRTSVRIAALVAGILASQFVFVTFERPSDYGDLGVLLLCSLLVFGAALFASSAGSEADARGGADVGR